MRRRLARFGVGLVALAFLWMTFWLGTCRIATRTSDEARYVGRASPLGPPRVYVTPTSDILVFSAGRLYRLSDREDGVAVVHAPHTVDVGDGLYGLGGYGLNRRMSKEVPEGLTTEGWRADFKGDDDVVKFTDMDGLIVQVVFKEHAPD